jgi:hypothetical protein
MHITWKLHWPFTKRISLIAGAYTTEAKWCPGSRQPAKPKWYTYNGERLLSSQRRCPACGRSIYSNKVTGRLLWHLPR